MNVWVKDYIYATCVNIKIRIYICMWHVSVMSVCVCVRVCLPAYIWSNNMWLDKKNDSSTSHATYFRKRLPYVEKSTYILRFYILSLEPIGLTPKKRSPLKSSPKNRIEMLDPLDLHTPTPFPSRKLTCHLKRVHFRRQISSFKQHFSVD